MALSKHPISCSCGLQQVSNKQRQSRGKKEEDWTKISNRLLWLHRLLFPFLSHSTLAKTNIRSTEQSAAGIIESSTQTKLPSLVHFNSSSVNRYARGLLSPKLLQRAKKDLYTCLMYFEKKKVSATFSMGITASSFVSCL